MRFALLIFIIVPVLEMLILIEVGTRIGAIPTVGLVLLTAVIGVWLLKLEGLATFQRVQNKLSAGQLPETELLEGIMLLVGGALLLTPGFFTDAIGFTCLIPFFRRPIARWLVSRAITFGTLKGAQAGFGQSFQAGFGNNEARGHGKTMEGEFTELQGDRAELKRDPVDDDGR